MSKELQERIYRNVEVSPTGCWVWKLSRTVLGYGRINYKSKARFAHRVSYLAYKGEIPDKMEIDHLCRVRECVNPDHLEPITHKENVRRGARGLLNPQRQAKFCIWGHEFNVKNTYWKNNPNGNKTRMCITCKDFRRTDAWKAYRSTN